MGARRRKGGGVPEMGFPPGPLFCVRTDVATKGAGTQILAQKIFSRINFPPHTCSQNDQLDVGIILSYVCWGRTPRPPAQQVGQPQPEPPSRHGDQGGGGGRWANELPCHHSPRKAIFFPPCFAPRGCSALTLQLSGRLAVVETHIL